jgi:hydrogenase maturation protease
MPDKPRLAVLGIGNPLCRDDGVGIRIIQELRKNEKNDNISLLDGGTAPDLTSLLDEQTKKLIVIDALKGGGEPGSLYRLEIGDENISEECPVSLHGLGILDSLRVMRELGMDLPKVILIGVEPADVSYGLGLSAILEARIPAIVQFVNNEISSTC